MADNPLDDDTPQIATPGPHGGYFSTATQGGVDAIWDKLGVGNPATGPALSGNPLLSPGNNMMAGLHLAQQARQQTAQPQPLSAADQKDIGVFHSHANSFLDALQGLSSIPRGQLSKDDVFKAVAGLMGKGLFADPKAQQGLVMQLAQLPDDENVLRQIIGNEMLHTATMQNHIRSQYPQDDGNA